MFPLLCREIFGSIVGCMCHFPFNFLNQLATVNACGCYTRLQHLNDTIWIILKGLGDGVLYSETVSFFSVW